MIYRSPSWIASYSFVMTPPALNTRSRKRLIPQIIDNLKGNDFFDTNNFFTLPNTLDDETFVHIIQQDTCLYDEDETKGRNSSREG